MAKSNKSNKKSNKNRNKGIPFEQVEVGDVVKDHLLDRYVMKIWDFGAVVYDPVTDEVGDYFESHPEDGDLFTPYGK